MSDWLHKRGSHMNGLTHKEAQALIQQVALSPLERGALTRHLNSCEECSRYRALHLYLSRHLQLEPVRATVAPELRATILDRIRIQHGRDQIMKPIYALASVAIFAIVVLGAWLTISTLSQQEPVSDSELPAEITLLPTEQPTLPLAVAPTDIAPTPTARPTEQPAVEPTVTSDPQLAYQSYEVGDEIYDLTVADFNGDSSPDIVLTDYGKGATYVMLNDGSGNYPDVTTYETGEGSFAIDAADFDGDAQLDLVITSDSADRIIVLINAGDGTFLEPVFYPLESTPSYVRTGDLDDDGFVDLALAYEPDWVGVMFNNGDGTFRQGEQYLVDDGAGYGSVHVGDLNGDRHLDLAVRHRPNPLVSVLLNNGDGTFAEPVSYEVGFNPMWLEMSDLDQDGALDLLIPNESGLVSILYNNGDGSFRESLDLETGGFPREVKTAELDGNDLPDLIVAPTGSGNVTTFANNGDGTFSKMKDYYLRTLFMHALFVTDVEGDGLRDLIGIGGGSSVYIVPFEAIE